MKNCKIFLRKIEELKLYMVEFNKFGLMKSNIYFLDYAIRGDN